MYIDNCWFSHSNEFTSHLCICRVRNSVRERGKRNVVANLDLIQAHFSDTSNLQISLSGIESHPLNCILKCNHAATGGLL